MPFNPDMFFIVDDSLVNATYGKPRPVSVYDLAVTGWTAHDEHNVPVPAQVVSQRDHYGTAGSQHHLEDLDVFWCGYAQDSVQFSILSGTNGPSVMLTPTMDGCSFGIGHSAPDGTVIVCHANAASQQASLTDLGTMPSAQKRAIKSVFRNSGVKTKYILGPDDYRWGKDAGVWRTVISASTYGVRDAGHWRFYRHSYRKDMGDYVYMGRKRIK